MSNRKPEDFPELRLPEQVRRLPTPADLSVESFKAAVELLGDDMPNLIICAPEQFSREMMAWLWNNSRITSFSVVPKEILKTPGSWCLYGYKNVVLSEVPW